MTITDGTIPSITVRGGFLREILGSEVGANLSPHSSARIGQLRPASEGSQKIGVARDWLTAGQSRRFL